ncbi:molybdopterin cofactor-binding domain-containing protein [Roseateles sp. BYS180W]|uniref:Molybdopterin cofactor-binding domain-containing protein n=1 Tax=Roseateles rivi TaxID=3299028 RepID=A0ABW7FUU2_9BURK
MSRLGTIARRSFLIGSVAVAGGVAFGIYRYQKPHPNPLLASGDGQSSALTPYVRVDAQGVSIITPRAEMGQGVHTTLAALVAEELDVAWESVRVEHGPPAAAYYNSAGVSEGVPFSPLDHGMAAEAMRGTMGVMAKFLAMQFTGGSSSMPDAFDKMRHAGAAARWALVQAAAEQWKLPAADLKTRDGEVIAPDGRRLSYIALAPAAAKIKLPSDLPLKPQAQWRLLGQSLPRKDVVAKSTGTATFAIDVQVPDMVYAAVRKNPALEAPLKRFDATAAKAMPGVLTVVELPGGVAAIANNTWRAQQAVSAVQCEWAAPVHPASTAELMAHITAAFDDKHQDSRMRNDGDVDTALAAGTPLEAEYRVPFLAHAPMEPPTAVARLHEGRLEIWAGVQIPTLVREQMAKLAGLDIERVQLHTLLMGGSFGRRLESDFVEQAVRLAMAVPGKAVKLTWSREEDLTQDAYRPAAVARFRGLVKDGRAQALDVRVASLSVLASQGARAGLAMPGPDKLLADGTFEQPYGVPHYRATAYRAPPAVPVSSWRSVGNSFNGFFMEGFIDELAHSAGADPLQFRLALLTHESSKRVLQAAADLAGWGQPLAKGRGRGVAYHLAFGVPVAQVIEVQQTPQGIRVERLCVAADVGTALDPRNIEAQLQGAAIFGLSAAMFGEITFAQGAVEQRNFHQYESVRMAQAPRIEVKVLALGGPIRGIGEPGTPPAAPALANAIFSATGQRIRELPLSKHIRFA